LMTNIVAANGGALIFKGLQKRDFSLDDYAGYYFYGAPEKTPLRVVPVEQPLEPSVPEVEQT
ncbi:MAG: hypothetical protein AABX63_01270, partial [Nanoarchaeota archaeon]